MGLYKQYLKPDDARKGYHEPTMSTKPPSKSKIVRAKAKKTALCPASLIAIELKGLAAPGEALKNNQSLHFSDVQKNHGFLPEGARRSKVPPFQPVCDLSSPYNALPNLKNTGFSQ